MTYNEVFFFLCNSKFFSLIFNWSTPEVNSQKIVKLMVVIICLKVVTTLEQYVNFRLVCLIWGLVFKCVDCCKGKDRNLSR